MHDSKIYPKRRPTVQAVSCFTREVDQQQQTKYVVLRRHKYSAAFFFFKSVGLDLKFYDENIQINEQNAFFGFFFVKKGTSLLHSQFSSGRDEICCVALYYDELRYLTLDYNSKFKQTTTAMAPSLNKRFNEQYNGCARSL